MTIILAAFLAFILIALAIGANSIPSPLRGRGARGEGAKASRQFPSLSIRREGGPGRESLPRTSHE